MIVELDGEVGGEFTVLDLLLNVESVEPFGLESEDERSAEASEWMRCTFLVLVEGLSADLASVSFGSALREGDAFGRDIGGGRLQYCVPGWLTYVTGDNAREIDVSGWEGAPLGHGTVFECVGGTSQFGMLRSDDLAAVLDRGWAWDRACR
ncbi:MAG: hypothetical protein QM809_01460 [Gordonia sp. (in: high G+C Gram-positive bacteria)]|uniref:hypothetical protein n=1 Tax=Gordonia sp. (in: high G+C Gram-positive bacteria) TaxID=84139 RepID=UPI0039E5D54C